MYSPQFYREERQDLINGLMEKYPFATLLSFDVSSISHLPFKLEKTKKGEPCLVGHMARANGQWQELSDRECKIIFQGPHGYVSPAWYAPKPDNVPTWNYAVVHVTGKFRVVEEPVEAFAAMDRLVTMFEAGYGTNWELPRGSQAIEGLMKGIVVFKITDLQFEAKFKLSQKLNKTDRENVIAQFQKSDDQNLQALAETMNEVL